MIRGRFPAAFWMVFALGSFLVGPAGAAAPDDAAASRSAAELLPASTLFYAEVERPAEVVRLILDHPLRKRLEQSPDYQKAFDAPQFKEFQAVVEAVEQKSGVEWRQALETTTGGGFVVAVDAATQGLVILARSTDPTTTKSVRDALFELARADAAGKGKPDPIETKEYRGFTAYKTAESVVANLGPWLVVSNKPKLAQAIADTLLDGGGSLADDVAFVEARKAERGNGKSGTGWAFLRMPPLRLVAAGHPLFDASAKSDNAAAVLVLGGLTSALRNAPYVTASFTLHEQGLKLSVTAPHEREWVKDSQKFFFAPEGGGADKPLEPKGTLLSVSTYRDLAAWWAAGPDLFTEGVAAQMARTDSELSMFLGGKSFGTDVLGSLAPQMQFVLASQDFKAAGIPQPSIKLPAGALVLRLREKQAAKVNLKKRLRVAFQSIVALANLDGASKGRPLLEIQSERRGKAEILYAVYEAPAEAQEAEDAQPDAANGPADGPANGPANAGDMKSTENDIYYNFSPALVVFGDRLMLCSTRQIADELVDLVAKQGNGTDAEGSDNTRIAVSAQPIAELLQVNRDRLIAQNMLEKGHSRDAAEKEIDVFVALVDAVQRATVRLTPTEESVTLELDVTTAAK